MNRKLVRTLAVPEPSKAKIRLAACFMGTAICNMFLCVDCLETSEFPDPHGPEKSAIPGDLKIRPIGWQQVDRTVWPVIAKLLGQRNDGSNAANPRSRATI